MRALLLKYTLFSIGLTSTILGALGVVLPLLPATPFFLLALFCFSKSSPKFQHWLLNLPGIGNDLKNWQTHKKIHKERKPAIYLSVVLSFLISISLLIDKPHIQLMLIAMMCILLLFIKRLPEY